VHDEIPHSEGGYKYDVGDPFGLAPLHRWAMLDQRWLDVTFVDVPQHMRLHDTHDNDGHSSDKLFR
jgi:hypothetical protein